MSEVISIGCLAVLMSACSAGVFSNAFRDNWPQFIGLTGVILWAVSETVYVIRFGSVGSRDLILHAALASFATGTSWKVWRHKVAKVDAALRGAPDLQSASWDSVAGGSMQPRDLP